MHGTVGYAALWVTDPERAATFFATALGWSYSEETPQHRMVADASPPQSIVSLTALPAGVWDAWPRHNTMFLSHAVDDVDAAVERIRSAGGRAEDPVDTGNGRSASCTDDQGLPFAVHQGDARGDDRLAYLTFEVADSARARAFFGAVFGWTFSSGSHDDGWQVDEMYPKAGLHGGHQQPTVVPMYAVDDIEATVTRVRAAGGTATDPDRQPYGLASSCADDQDTRFYLGQLA
ncbi:hypothetical protein PSA01_47700 [Pseudonocardia saturnea]|nr:hypothetical protein Pdca_52160 [Pseudonocardia autotrophica]GEC27741.1 hypothetical protein PSA01_47700 [Pseudonocardia saturnea]